jgi:hypothetical protein
MEGNAAGGCELTAKGTEYATIMSAPEKIPADPNPAIARPRIKAIEFGAIPHTKLPSSNMPIATRYTYLMEKKV